MMFKFREDFIIIQFVCSGVQMSMPKIYCWRKMKKKWRILVCWKWWNHNHISLSATFLIIECQTDRFIRLFFKNKSIPFFYQTNRQIAHIWQWCVISGLFSFYKYSILINRKIPRFRCFSLSETLMCVIHMNNNSTIQQFNTVYHFGTLEWLYLYFLIDGNLNEI